MPSPPRFDESYYYRYYKDPRTRVYDPGQQAALVCGVVSMIEWFDGRLRRVLDVGAGVGGWGTWLRQHRPKVAITSTELDPEVCARYGHLQVDISRWRAPRGRTFDLVVCQGVLPYLDDARAAAAIENIAAMSAGFLYLEAITRRDVTVAIDRKRTDLRIHRRAGAWYLRRLAPHFRRVGAGLFYAREGELEFFELEAAP